MGDIHSFQYSDAEDEGEEKFVLLKERAADIVIYTASEVVVEILDPFLQAQIASEGEIEMGKRV